MEELKVAFVFSHSKTIGAGHKSRCDIIAAALKKKFNADVIDETEKADIIVVDYLNADDKFLAKIKRKKRAYIVLIDTCNRMRRFRNADLVINGTACEDTAIIIERGVEHWFGRNYNVIGPEFSRANLKPRKISKDIKKILVAIGSGDPHGIIPRILPILALRGYVGTVAVNSLHDKRIEVPPIFVVKKDLPSLCSEMLNCDIAIGSAGIIMYQLCMTGTPSIIVCKDELEEENALAFEKTGAVLKLSIGDKVEDADMRIALRKMVDFAFRNEMSENARRFITDSALPHLVEQIGQEYEIRKST